MPTAITDLDPLVSAIFEGHPEALVIYTDPDQDRAGESKIGVFTKLKKAGVLSGVLVNILDNLRGQNAEKHSSKTKSNPNERQGQTTTKRDRKGGYKAVKREDNKSK